MNLQLIISDAFLFFRSHLTQICSLCLPWLLAIAIVDVLITAGSDPSQGISPLYVITLSFNLLIYPIYTAALILLMAKRAQLEQPDNKTLVASAIKMWQPFFVLRMISAGLTAAGVVFAVITGIYLAILPSVYVAVRLSFSEFYLVLEDNKPLEAIAKSFQATRPFFFQILLLLALFVTPLLALNLFFGHLLSTQEINPFVNVIATVSIAFFMLFLDVLLFRAYMFVKEGASA